MCSSSVRLGLNLESSRTSVSVGSSLWRIRDQGRWFLVANVVVFDRICQLIASVPRVQEPTGSSGFVTWISPGVVAQHCGVTEWVGKWKLNLKHLMGVQIQS